MARVVVIGAGIGGLITALCLDRAGFDVLLCEQSAAFTAVGAGIQIGPNGTRVLIRLGLGDELADVAAKTESVEYRRWQDNRLVAQRPRGALLEERFGAPHYDLFRPDLVDILARQLKPELVRFGSRCVDVTVADDGRAVVAFADGTTETANVVVGADGHHSQVRAVTIGPVPARFSGMVAHRLLVPSDRLSAEPPARIWMGPHRLVMSYPIGRGFRFLNMILCCLRQSGRTSHGAFR
ncbi:FAD-dependent monooxygenase [Kibdelosporangium aridum]|uniref:FAD-dependent monooxygenase n=1 Tax=Kibdelosporangium aridum TaxID=2030 RepID=UPI0035EBE060